MVAVWWIACLLWSCGWLFLKIGLSGFGINAAVILKRA